MCATLSVLPRRLGTGRRSGEVVGEQEEGISMVVVGEEVSMVVVVVGRQRVRGGQADAGAS